MAGNDTAAAMISLCVWSYLDEKPKPGESVSAQQARMRADINSALTTTLPGWSVVWGPGLTQDRANMMYAAGNTATKEFAAVIRGTDWSFFEDWLEDFGVYLVHVPPPYNSSVKIAHGTRLGLDILHAMTDPNTGQTLTDFFSGLPQESQIFVTGHSLGGCLASAFAPWLVDDGIASTTMQVYTFAAPTAGDQDFADYYNNLFSNSDGGTRAWRYYNEIDVVPNGWASIDAVKKLFSPSPTCPDAVRALIDVVGPLVPTFVQTGSPGNGSVVPLDGQVQPVSGWDAWVKEVADQHSSKYYAELVANLEISATTAKLANAAAKVKGRA